MAVVLVPNFCGKLVESLTGHVPVVSFQPVHPNHEFSRRGSALQTACRLVKEFQRGRASLLIYSSIS